MRCRAALLVVLLLSGTVLGQEQDAEVVDVTAGGSVVEPAADERVEAEEPVFVKVDVYATTAAPEPEVTAAPAALPDPPEEENATHSEDGHGEEMVPTPPAENADTATMMYRGMNATAAEDLSADNATDIPLMEGNNTVVVNSTVIIINSTVIETNSTSNATEPDTDDPNALKCFVCSSHDEPLCSDPFDAEAATEAGLLHQCGPLSGVRRVCRKNQQVVPGDSRTIRSCGHDNDSRDCYLTSEGLTASRVCHCMHDGCNGAAALGAKMTLLVMAAVAGRAAVWW